MPCCSAVTPKNVIWLPTKVNVTLSPAWSVQLFVPPYGFAGAPSPPA
jgi:hypothetical protein